jgi:two-component sensor histidine kinase
VENPHPTTGHAAGRRLSTDVTPEHREQVRALLANIRALIQRTAVAPTSVSEYVAHLNGRLDALARIQEILMRDPADQVDLAELVADEFLAQGVLEHLDSSASTPSLPLDRTVAAALALVLHELTTNAIKYGQLQGTSRKVSVRWGPSEELEGWAVLEWREQSLAAPAAETNPDGFGFNLVRNTLPAQIAARTSIRLGPQGLFCRIVFRATGFDGAGIRHGRGAPV